MPHRTLWIFTVGAGQCKVQVQVAVPDNLGNALCSDSLYTQHHTLSLQDLECSRATDGAQGSVRKDSASPHPALRSQVSIPSGGNIVLVWWDWILVLLLTTDNVALS